MLIVVVRVFKIIDQLLEKFQKTSKTAKMNWIMTTITIGLLTAKTRREL
jgi:hypothetical protein